MAITYGKSGVNVEAGDALVSWLQKTGRKSPHQEKIVSGIGGFGAQFLFDFPKIKEPVLVSCTDGVGTKVKLASHFENYRGIGQDLVAMCLNDMICEGASPLFFLDYYATGKLDLKAAQEFLEGVRQACFDCNCALIGGETAEMPGVYDKNDFDCAGFAVGVVGRKDTLGPHRVKVGDVLVGVSSSGFHSNGYSLLRKVFAKDLEKWQDILLTPTALYVKLFEKIKTQVHALAHITGSGIENILRVFPEGTSLHLNDWDWPEAFREVQKRAELSKEQMLKTLNCGVGLVVVAPEENAAVIKKEIKSCGFKAFELGVVEKGKEKGEAYFQNKWK